MVDCSEFGWQAPQVACGAPGEGVLRDIEVNPGKPDSQTVLDIPIWDFDNQAAKPIEPVELDYGDVVRVTCKHVQWLRDRLPAFEGIPDKYVVWGEGTTDEMCLGILTVTRP